MMKTKRELELEIELCMANESIYQLSSLNAELNLEKNWGKYSSLNAEYVNLYGPEAGKESPIEQQEVEAVNSGVMALTREQAVIISGYTGFMLCDMALLTADIEKRTGHELDEKGLIKMGQKAISELYKDDIEKLRPSVVNLDESDSVSA
ncbi:hypothetical protein [Raoultella sp. HC6]|uniref:DUF7736 domain-containing protein n=1 Tax=Raoultella sp. HC6 TaxID=2923366 RepID=UPI001F514F22|nr:hypothetical protein [Raoultella sp. HC6]